MVKVSRGMASGLTRTRGFLRPSYERYKRLTIEVYGKPSCVQCTATSLKLGRLDLEYSYTDVSTDESALEFTKSLGFMQAPVVVVRSADGGIADTWSGFNPDKLNALAA